MDRQVDSILWHPSSSHLRYKLNGYLGHLTDTQERVRIMKKKKKDKGWVRLGRERIREDDADRRSRLFFLLLNRLGVERYVETI